MDFQKSPAPEPEQKKEPKPPKKIKLRFVSEVPFTGAVGRLTCGDVVLPRGEVVEVSPEQAAQIRKAFAGRYEIEEVS